MLREKNRHYTDGDFETTSGKNSSIYSFQEQDAPVHGSETVVH